MILRVASLALVVLAVLALLSATNTGANAVSDV